MRLLILFKSSVLAEPAKDGELPHFCQVGVDVQAS